MFEDFNGGQQNKHGFVLLPKLLHPKSVGSIRLKSQNPFDYPLIDPGYLEDEQDVEILLDGNFALPKMFRRTINKSNFNSFLTIFKCHL